MPGILYIVATPIGNLEDVTIRALRVLREVTVIAAEDTRRTARLLQHYSIPTPTTSLHEHNERARIPSLLARLERGDTVALVSDAGTPVLSDPGAVLIAAAHEAGIKVEPIPGPSAALAVLSASGTQSEGFLFAGFPPSRSLARKRWLAPLAAESRAIILFEAPHRIRRLLEDLAAIFGERRVTIGREVTKIHEELVTRPIYGHLAALGEPRGEFTLVIHPADPDIREGPLAPTPKEIRALFGEMTELGGLSRRQALRALATKFDLSSRAVYQLLEESK